MRAVILYDGGSDEWSAQDVAAVMANVREVRTALRRAGHEPVLVPVHLGDFRWLTRARKAELVFNLCEGINGKARYEDFVVGALELTGVPFTGCRHWPIAVCHRKYVANTLLAAGGLPVPAFTLAQANKIPADFPLPAIVKPNAEDASVGIDRDAVCTTRRALRKRVATMLEHFDEVLVQQYIGGREFNVGFIGDRMLPISEIRFDQMPEGSWPIVTYAAKWHAGSAEDLGTQPVCPAHAPADMLRRIGVVARHAWHDHGARRGIWPRGPAGGRAGDALGPRGESLPRPVERRRAGADGSRRGMELRRAGAAGGGGDAQPRPPGVRRRRRAGTEQHTGVTVAAVVAAAFPHACRPRRGRGDDAGHRVLSRGRSRDRGRGVRRRGGRNVRLSWRSVPR